MTFGGATGTPGGGRPLDTALSAADFARFRDHVHERSGIFLEDDKAESLRLSLVARASQVGAATLADYYRRLVIDEAEFRELIDLVTINETSFLRFPAQFDLLRDSVIPELLLRSPRKGALRVWSAGCSTGEEAYSLAMTLLDSPAADLGWHFEVLATDVSNSALAVAEAGVYPERALGAVPRGLVARYFEPWDGGLRVSEPVRNIVQFRYHNLIRDPFPVSMGGEWDVVFCRNVTIYFKLDSTRRIVEGFRQVLRPGGYLFIGHSESLATISDRFETVERDGVYVYRTPESGAGEAGSAGDRTADVPVRDLSQARARFERDSALRSAGAASAFGLGSADATPRHAPPMRSEAILAAEQAESALAAGDTTAAHSAARRIADADPRGVDAPLLDAQAFADEGDWEAAAEACRRALSANPLLPSARYLLGIVEMRRGDSSAAERELRRTIYVDPGFALAHLNLANLFRAQDRWDEAAQEYEAAVGAIHGEGSDAWLAYLGGFDTDTLERTARRGLEESRAAAGGV